MENFAGKIQPFAAAVAPPESITREGDLYLSILGLQGLYNAENIREEMGEAFAAVTLPGEQAGAPAMEFAEL